MNSIKTPKIIELITSLFYRFGLWHYEDEAGLIIKIFYSIYHCLFPISILAGVATSGSKDESIFLVQESLVVTVLLVKLLYIIWRKKEICDLLQKLCVYSIEDDKLFTIVHGELKIFEICITILVFLSFCTASYTVLVVPFVGNEKKLFLNIGFPLDWKNGNFAFWLAFTFFCTEVILTFLAFLFSVLIWYLMINCALRFKIIGYQIKNIGAEKALDVNVTTDKRKKTDFQKEKIFLQDLIAVAESRKRMTE